MTETPTERRLRAIVADHDFNDGLPDEKAIDKGRQAIALLVEFAEADWNAWVAKRDALLTACQED